MGEKLQVKFDTNALWVDADLGHYKVSDSLSSIATSNVNCDYSTIVARTNTSGSWIAEQRVGTDNHNFCPNQYELDWAPSEWTTNITYNYDYNGEFAKALQEAALYPKIPAIFGVKYIKKVDINKCYLIKL